MHDSYQQGGICGEKQWEFIKKLRKNWVKIEEKLRKNWGKIDFPQPLRGNNPLPPTNTTLRIKRTSVWARCKIIFILFCEFVYFWKLMMYKPSDKNKSLRLCFFLKLL